MTDRKEGDVFGRPTFEVSDDPAAPSNDSGGDSVPKRTRRVADTVGNSPTVLSHDESDTSDDDLYK